MQIPIIDFAPWTEPSSPEERQKVAHDLVEACHKTGFVYIENYGITAPMVDEAFAWSKKFYWKGLTPHLLQNFPGLLGSPLAALGQILIQDSLPGLHTVSG
ncbi:hypothetical protein IFR05_007048 [Cadophora sp. M221]|nr:hypothetical protein IFR05_007048 [Cadophora sp. M221]